VNHVRVLYIARASYAVSVVLLKTLRKEKKMSPTKGVQRFGSRYHVFMTDLVIFRSSGPTCLRYQFMVFRLPKHS
jgi:hypothetical protein